MIARFLVAHHFAIYQTAVALIGIVAVIHILWNYSWQLSLGCAALTVASYWIGQGGVTLIQRQRERRSSSLD